jgi:4-hydroxy-tetrahydrodipicolinate reductase
VTNPLAVVVVGAAGRMGAHACELVEAAPDMRLAARIEEGDDLERAAAGADVGLELTRAGLGARHGHALLAAGVRPVIGTSGVRPDEVRALDADARERGLGGLVVPNFCLGAALLARVVGEAARLLPDVEIVEAHHPGKLDAPSGTARDLAERIAEARGEAEPRRSAPGERPAARGLSHAGVSIHALRQPAVHSRHEIRFAGEAERLTLSHEALGPAAFDAGILFALRRAPLLSGVTTGLDALLEQPPRR